MNKQSYKPEIIEYESKVKKIIAKNPTITYINAFDRQLRELFVIKNPQLAFTNKQQLFNSSSYDSFAQKKSKDFIFAYFPWNQSIVKCVTEKDYFTLKTNRNKNLITEEEQKKLSHYKIAVLGMSVGSNISLVLTQAGISQEIIIADPDSLDTTNLNRIIGGVHQIGLNKTVIAARKIYEDNPYAKVKIYPNGINEDEMKSIFKKKAIDCLIEEIDNIPLKIKIRKLAKIYKIPIISIADNGDGVVLVVERYDLGYDKIFNKDDKYWENKFNKAVTKEVIGNIIMEDIVGGVDKVDPKMLISVDQIFKKELVSWSQLGSTAILGGVVVTKTLKKIILDKDKRLFIRHHISIII